MRKALSLPFDIPPGIILPILLLLILVAILAGPAKGKIDESTDYLDSSKLDWTWSCTETIDTPMDFETFMTKLHDVAKACDDDKNKCGEKLCVIMDFGNPGDYNRIDSYTLRNYELSMFNNYILSEGAVSMGANVFCEKTDADWGDYEIDPYYTGGTFDRKGLSSDLPGIKTMDGTPICWSYSAIQGEFAVAQGSKVMMTTTYHENSIWSLDGHSIDLKVVVKGGTFTNDITPPPGECTEGNDASCREDGLPSWGYCEAGQCNYQGYCLKHPEDTSRCEEYTIVCNRGTTDGDRNTLNCVNPPTKTCSNGYKVQGYNLMNEYNTNIFRATIMGDGDNQIFPIKEGEEKWVHKSYLGKLWGTNPDDPTAKLSVLFKTIEPTGSNYKITIVQGCY